MNESFKASEKAALQTMEKPLKLSPIVSTPADVRADIEQIQALTGATPAKLSRRALFCWLRIYVREGSDKRVNLAIPIPFPLVGLLLPHHLPAGQALKLRNELARSHNTAEELEEYLASTMALELIRVEEDNQLVIIGLD
jgi:hypothetical protein